MLTMACSIRHVTDTRLSNSGLDVVTAGDHCCHTVLSTADVFWAAAVA